MSAVEEQARPQRQDARYILITQCLQNDLFLNPECRLALPEQVVRNMLMRKDPPGDLSWPVLSAGPASMCWVMSRPVCSRHPQARVKRNGYYGKDKQFVLWRCAGGEGERPHQIRPELSTRLVGGAEGACDHCERPWGPTDGLPQAVRDRFVLRHKAETLVALGRGMSYRQAAWEARRNAGHPTRAGASRSFSDDRRMTGDWVGQHAEIVAAPLLPDRWPKIVAIDELEVRLLRFRPDGTRVQRGGEAYTVMGVVGYEDEHSKGRLWRLAARAGHAKADWASVFAELPGKPEIVVCDGASEGRNAAEARWRGVEVLRCAWHLEERTRVRLKRAGHASDASPLWRMIVRRTATGKVPCEVFLDPHAHLCFRRALLQAIDAEPSNAELRKLDASLRDQHEDIVRAIWIPHRPLTIGAAEEKLDQVSRLLGDRARLFENLARLNCLLNLVHLHLLGLDDPAAYARLMRENHLRHEGSAPPRRAIDGAGFETLPAAASAGS
ncbi:MAG: hypothetical protein H0U05_00275 [Actinobacteria bacterium]|nr:hypothetical protein [Actinomycetota bacterium]